VTEETGFPSEPTFSLDALAGHELTQERLYAAQNTVVRLEAEIARLENERDGKVLVDPEDLRAVLDIAFGAAWLLGTRYEAASAAKKRLARAAGVADVV
jgi:hypothetical protein